MLREILPNSPYTKEGPLGQEATSWTYIADHISKEHFNWLWHEGVEQGLFRHGDLYSGTAKAMTELAKIGEVVIITHRPPQAVNDTLAWLSYHKFDLSGVYIFSKQEPKSSVKCNIYIDDKPENCIDLFAHTYGHVAIIDRPWNRGEDNLYDLSGIRRVYNWQEFIDFVKEGL